MKVEIGTKFRWSYADTTCEWEVKSRRARGIWNCEIVDVDYKGEKQIFTTEQIQSALGMAAVWQESTDNSDNFFRRLIPGQIVHFKGLGGGWLRCKITEENKLLPIAMVGDWADYDLPHREKNGRITLGYQATQIKEGRVFRPHASCIYEYNIDPRCKDPRLLSPLSLEVSEMEPAEQAMAEQYGRLDRLRAIVNQNNTTPDVIFAQVKNFLDPEAI